MPPITIDPLPNLWRLFGLRESPYFQETLGNEGYRYPLSLFVGRTREADQLLAVIGGSRSSRQGVGGPPGVGKTTLVQRVKGRAYDAGYWTNEGVVPFYPDDRAPQVMGRLLGGLYDAVLSARPMSTGAAAMRAAQQLVRVARLESGGASFSAMGIGAGFSKGSSASTPPDAMLLEGPRLIRDLLALAREAGAPGVLLHLNNLENLSDADARNAADVLRSLRDTVLLQDGLHVLLVGTTDAIMTVTTTHAQLRSVFPTPLSLAPLPIREVEALLAARYQFLRLEPKRAPVPPVAPSAVKALYPLFRGDLRALLKALEEGSSLLMGLVGKPGGSLPLAELRPALKARYAGLLQPMTAARRQQLIAWAAAGPASVQDQASLTRLWRITQGAVSTALADLGREGFVIALGREGAGPTRYALSGTSRLIFD